MASPTQSATARTNERRTLAAIRDSIATRGYPPSVSEVSTELGVSKRTVRVYLANLTAAGAIEVDAGVPRGIRLNP